MNTIIRSVLALIAGLVAGSLVNMGLVMISGSIIPPPEGADITTMDGLRNSLPLFEPKHFVFPFLAHALGTLVGAFCATLIANNRKMLNAMVIGFLFLAGGIYNVVLLPAPVWFSVLDLGIAYIPMAFFGYILASRINR